MISNKRIQIRQKQIDKRDKEETFQIYELLKKEQKELSSEKQTRVQEISNFREQKSKKKKPVLKQSKHKSLGKKSAWKK